MCEMNQVISYNIQKAMERTKTDKASIAKYIGITDKELRFKLDCRIPFYVPELKSIAELMNVPVDNLIAIPKGWKNQPNPITGFKKRVHTDEARKGLDTLDRIADMILFYEQAVENGMEAE